MDEEESPTSTQTASSNDLEVVLEYSEENSEASSWESLQDSINKKRMHLSESQTEPRMPSAKKPSEPVYIHPDYAPPPTPVMSAFLETLVIQKKSGAAWGDPAQPLSLHELLRLAMEEREEEDESYVVDEAFPWDETKRSKGVQGGWGWLHRLNAQQQLFAEFIAQQKGFLLSRRELPSRKSILRKGSRSKGSDRRLSFEEESDEGSRRVKGKGRRTSIGSLTPSEIIDEDGQRSKRKMKKSPGRLPRSVSEEVLRMMDDEESRREDKKGGKKARDRKRSREDDSGTLNEIYVRKKDRDRKKHADLKSRDSYSDDDSLARKKHRRRSYGSDAEKEFRPQSKRRARSDSRDEDSSKPSSRQTQRRDEKKDYQRSKEGRRRDSDDDDRRRKPKGDRGRDSDDDDSRRKPKGDRGRDSDDDDRRRKPKGNRRRDTYDDDSRKDSLDSDRSRKKVGRRPSFKTKKRRSHDLIVERDEKKHRKSTVPDDLVGRIKDISHVSKAGRKVKKALKEQTESMEVLLNKMDTYHISNPKDWEKAGHFNKGAPAMLPPDADMPKLLRYIRETSKPPAASETPEERFTRLGLLTTAVKSLQALPSELFIKKLHPPKNKKSKGGRKLGDVIPAGKARCTFCSKLYDLNRKPDCCKQAALLWEIEYTKKAKQSVTSLKRNGGRQPDTPGTLSYLLSQRIYANMGWTVLPSVPRHSETYTAQDGSIRRRSDAMSEISIEPVKPAILTVGGPKKAGSFAGNTIIPDHLQTGHKPVYFPFDPDGLLKTQEEPTFLVQEQPEWAPSKAEGIRHRFYPDNKIFSTFFSNGTGEVLYPDGSPAVIISAFHKGFQFTVLKAGDSPEQKVVLAIFTNDGNGVIYDDEGHIRVTYTPWEGVRLDAIHGLTTKWKWTQTSPHVHAPPLQPLCLKLNHYISVRILRLDNVVLQIEAFQRGMRLKVGQRYGAPPMPQTQSDTDLEAASSYTPAPKQLQHNFQLMLNSLRDACYRWRVANIKMKYEDAKRAKEMKYDHRDSTVEEEDVEESDEEDDATSTTREDNDYKRKKSGGTKAPSRFSVPHPQTKKYSTASN